MRRLPAVTAADVLALAYAVVIVVYWLIPQGWLDGDATARGELLALRHHLLPVAAYALGRLLSGLWRTERLGGSSSRSPRPASRLIGLLDLAFVSLQAWRDSGVPGWYREQLGLDYEGLSGLPENWVYNTGDEDNPIRRLVSTFLSPLASAYAFVVALVYSSSRPFRWWTGVLALLLFAGPAVHAHACGVGALAVGLVVLAAAQRRLAPLVLALASVAVAAVFFAAYPTSARPRATRPEELEFLRQNAESAPGTSSDPFSPSESSLASHLRNLRDGVAASSTIRRATGSGTRAWSRSARGSRSRRASRRSSSSGSTSGSPALAAFVLWSVVRAARPAAQGGLGGGRLRCGPPARPADGRHRGALARGRGLGRRGHGAGIEARGAACPRTTAILAPT